MNSIKFDQNGFLWDPNIHDRWLSKLAINDPDTLELQFTDNVNVSAIGIWFEGCEGFMTGLGGPRIVTELFISDHEQHDRNREITILESLAPKRFHSEIMTSFSERLGIEQKKRFCLLALMDGFVSFWFSQMRLSN